MIAWREKFWAFGLHFLITSMVAIAAAALIFLIWFPGQFAIMVGGTKLFLLIVGCDLALGPLISLVIYNSKKSRRELLLDYSIVGIVQLAALAYGLYAMSGSRPAYIAFVTDRIEVIAASEIDPSDLPAAKHSAYRSLPKWGARYVATVAPPEERNEALFTALGGKDVGFLPKYYAPYDSQADAIRRTAHPISELRARHPQAGPLIDEALADLKRNETELGWLPVRHPKGFWTALIDTSTALPVRYLNVDPY